MARHQSVQRHQWHSCDVVYERDSARRRPTGQIDGLRIPVKITGRRNCPPRSDFLTGVQYRLNASGFGAGPVDGVNGPKTKKAVTEFQKTYALRVDGIPGPQTQTKLVEICGF
jgi:Putative peptidoglycan binding domain